MMNDLPAGWETTQLGALLSGVVGGGTPSKANAAYFQGSIPFMTVKDMQTRFIADTQDHISEQALADSASTLIPPDTLIIASRMSLGKITRPLMQTAINQDLKALFLHDGIDKTYIEYVWRANQARIQQMGTGTTVKGIRLEDIRALEVPVAPRAEQINIGKQLDTLLARINACNDRFGAIPALLKRLRQTILDAAVSGALTTEWRSDVVTSAFVDSQLDTGTGANLPSDKLPFGWRWARFGEFVSSIRSGTSGVPGHVLSALPVLRSSSVRPMQLDLDDVRFLPDGASVRTEDLLEDGDMLFTRLSGSLDYVANCAVVQGLGTRRVYYPDRLFRAKLTHAGSAQYFELCFGSPSLRKYLEVEAKSSAGHQRVSMGAITGFPIPLPPPAEQTEIVRRVEALFALADRIEARCTAARTHAQRLAPQLLAKAFRGELVPQDPNDEPASVLLARIAAERASGTPTPKAGPPRKPRAVRAPKETAAMTKSRQDADVKDHAYLAAHLRHLGGQATAEALFKVAELPLADFYKQLAWEVAHGHVKDGKTVLEAGHAA